LGFEPIVGTLYTPAGAFAAEGRYDATGGVAGGQIGYRWQSGTCVHLKHRAIGLTWSAATRAWHSLASPTSPIDAFGLFTAIGYAANNVLFYVKGGAAVTDNKRVYTGVLAGSTGDDTRWVARSARASNTASPPN
jgi:outer membrane immunogenic protein